MGHCSITLNLERVNNRLIDHADQLAAIRDQLTQLDIEFRSFISTIFPIVIERLYEENEEDKVKLIINGFEHIVDNSLNDEHLILTYYDILKELRLAEIKRLMEHTIEFDKWSQPAYKGPVSLVFSDQTLDEMALRQYIDNKLEKNGLIHPLIESSAPSPKCRINRFGKNFLTFFATEKYLS